MIMKLDQAAQMLTGMTLEGGWIVGDKITNRAEDKGGVYSCCYEVNNGKRKGFLKAFDYTGAEKVGEADPVEFMKNLLNAFSLEREILQRCQAEKCSNVVQLLNHGGLSVPGAKQYPKVEYLILEFASDGDINDKLKQNVSMEWKLRSLHQLCKGLDQIHKIGIAHQDIKPRNVVLNENITKLTDFGSAVHKNYNPDDLPKHLKDVISGTWAYAPPELLYREVYSNSFITRIGCDLYLLGSMVVYYFTNINMTAQLSNCLAPDLRWTNVANYGKYKELKPYLIKAFEDALEQIRQDINDREVEEKVLLMIRYLCHPDPEQRGHKKTILEKGPNYGLARFVTMFDVLATHYSIKNK